MMLVAALAAAAIASNGTRGSRPHSFPLRVVKGRGLATGFEKRILGKMNSAQKSQAARYSGFHGIFVDLYIGDNHQKQELLMDFLSADLVVYSVWCPHCPTTTITSQYSPYSSGYWFPTLECTQDRESLYRVPNRDLTLCLAYDTWSDGSRWSAVFVEDDIYIESSGGSAVKVPIGCIYDEQGPATGSSNRQTHFVPDGAAGSVGAGWRTTSTTGHKGPFQKYMEAQGLRNYMSICTNTEGIGHIWLGMLPDTPIGKVIYEPLVIWDDMSWSPGDPWMRGLWAVSVTDIAVGGTFLELGAGAFLSAGRKRIHAFSMLDFGSQYLFLQHDVYSAVMDRFSSAGVPVDSSNPYCLVADPESDYLPDILIELTKVALKITPQQYLSNTGNCPSGSSDFHIADGGIYTVLGFPVLQNYLTVWDYEAKLVGFAQAPNCALPAPPAAGSADYARTYEGGHSYNADEEYTTADQYSTDEESGAAGYAPPPPSHTGGTQPSTDSPSSAIYQLLVGLAKSLFEKLDYSFAPNGECGKSIQETYDAAHESAKHFEEAYNDKSVHKTVQGFKYVGKFLKQLAEDYEDCCEPDDEESSRKDKYKWGTVWVRHSSKVGFAGLSETFLRVLCTVVTTLKRAGEKLLEESVFGEIAVAAKEAVEITYHAVSITEEIWGFISNWFNSVFTDAGKALGKIVAVVINALTSERSAVRSGVPHLQLLGNATPSSPVLAAHQSADVVSKALVQTSEPAHSTAWAATGAGVAFAAFGVVTLGIALASLVSWALRPAPPPDSTVDYGAV